MKYLTPESSEVLQLAALDEARKRGIARVHLMRNSMDLRLASVPYAEFILRGIKKNEFRSRPTHIRGLVYVYAALKLD